MKIQVTIKCMSSTDGNESIFTECEVHSVWDADLGEYTHASGEFNLTVPKELAEELRVGYDCILELEVKGS